MPRPKKHIPASRNNRKGKFASLKITLEKILAALQISLLELTTAFLLINKSRIRENLFPAHLTFIKIYIIIYIENKERRIKIGIVYMRRIRQKEVAGNHLGCDEIASAISFASKQKKRKMMTRQSILSHYNYIIS